MMEILYLFNGSPEDRWKKRIGAGEDNEQEVWILRHISSDSAHTVGAIFMKVCEFAAGGAGLVMSEVKK